jgi:nucleotide-binding universal stress UspA family protein
MRCSGCISAPFHPNGARRETDAAMTPRAIVSYDDTPNDRDALTLARVLADAGVELVLAYVRHATQIEPEREQLEDDDAHALLERGARTLGDLDVERRVVLSGSTAEGLSWLAEREEAQTIVFGSDYRTAAGHVSPQRSTETLLDGGFAALAIAPANYRSENACTFGRLGLFATPDDDAALGTAHDLAESLGARVTTDEPYVDLLVIGSRPEAPDRRVLISGAAQNAIDNATSPVLVLPRGVSVRFPLVVAG